MRRMHHDGTNLDPFEPFWCKLCPAARGRRAQEPAHGAHPRRAALAALVRQNRQARHGLGLLAQPPPLSGDRAHFREHRRHPRAPARRLDADAVGTPRRSGPDLRWPVRPGARCRTLAPETPARRGLFRTLRHRPERAGARLDCAAARRQAGSAGESRRRRAERPVPARPLRRPIHRDAGADDFAFPRRSHADVLPPHRARRGDARLCLRPRAQRRDRRSHPARGGAHLPRLGRQLPLHGRIALRSDDRPGHGPVAFALRG